MILMSLTQKITENSMSLKAASLGDLSAQSFLHQSFLVVLAMIRMSQHDEELECTIIDRIVAEHAVTSAASTASASTAATSRRQHNRRQLCRDQHRRECLQCVPKQLAGHQITWTQVHVQFRFDGAERSGL